MEVVDERMARQRVGLWSQTLTEHLLEIVHVDVRVKPVQHVDGAAGGGLDTGDENVEDVVEEGPGSEQGGEA